MQFHTHADPSTHARRIGLKTTLWMMVAVGLVLSAAAPARAQQSCGGNINPTIMTEPDVDFSYLVGTELTINVRLGIGTIQGGVLIRIPSMQYALECLRAKPVPAPLDCSAAESGSVAYLGDTTITTDCIGAMNEDVVVTSDNPDGGQTPNNMTFTFTPPVELPADQTCNVSFMIQIVDVPPMDITPSFIEEEPSFEGTCFDEDGNRTLVGGAAGSLAIPVLFCGDETITPEIDETCDGTNLGDTACTECRGPESDDPCTCCGDGIVQDTSDEQCDEGAGNSDAPDSLCRTDCTLPFCGDGIIDPGADETCDPPGEDAGNGNLCRVDCTFCGDNILDAGEDCDLGDMNGVPGSGCASDCTTPDVQACCLENGACIITDLESCALQGGTPLGPGSACSPALQGCCFGETGQINTCEDLDPLCCELAGGEVQDELCSGTIEACCLEDGTCLEMDPTCCDEAGGEPLGPNSTCSGEPPKACCYTDADDNAICQDGVDAACCTEVLGGTPSDEACDNSVEACCLPDNSCQEMDPTCCEALLGSPQGPGSTCDTTVCVSGCCLDNGTCQDNVPPANCVEVDGTPVSACGGSLEACCIKDECLNNIDTACCIELGGEPQGPGSMCGGTEEACCFDSGECRVMDPTCCEAQDGTPLPGVTECSPEAPQACCIDDGCTNNLNPTCCEALGGDPQGPGTACNGIEACCLPDGTCRDMDPLCCLEQDGMPQGPGIDCDNTVCVECTVEVTKTCVVEQPVSSDYVCDKPIETLTMIWDGSQAVRIVAWKGNVGSQQLADIGGIAVGDEVSVSGYTGSPNDVFWEVFEAGPGGDFIGLSKFHLSCSDQDMNGAEDCGKRQGNGKSNDDDSLINDWLLEGIVDEGGVLDCTSDDPGVGEPLCEIPPLMPGDQCDGGVEYITFRYIGGGCGQTTNFQEGALECSGDAGMTQPVAVVITADEEDADVTPSAQVIGLDDTFTISATGDKLKSNTEFDIVQNGDAVQSIKFHTSCSKPLNVGDIFGAVEVVAFKSRNGGLVQLGSNVTYYYVIENTGPIAITNVTVEDNVLGTVDGSPILLIPPGETVTLSQEVFVDAPVTNTVDVVAQSTAGECLDSAEATVSIAEPPPCDVVGDCKLKLEDDKIEWKLFNVGYQDAIIESIEITWPLANQKLKKIKLDGDIYKEPKLPPPSAVIDTFIGDISKRTIEAGKDETLEIEFEEKKKPQFQDDYMITVNFVQGCSVTFAPDECPYVECDKPIEALSMIWDGSEPVRIVAWKGSVGSQQLADIDDIAVGDEVMISGYTGSPNDVFWEVFEAGPGGDLIGLSKFHLSCSDRDMNGPEDCGKRQGNGKSNDDDSLINDWLLEGILDAGGTLDCSDL